MRTPIYSGRPAQRGERGQTILLVAVSIVALLSMAALAIDVVTLYVAKSEIQRAADAAALAGAKAVADSGVTTVQSTDGTNLPLAEALAQTMASTAVNALLSESSENANFVAGQAPTLVGAPAVSWSRGNNNPTVTVTLQQNNLPTFFARIFARTSASTTATAVAEIYNPINPTQAEYTPTATQCVKPWMMANADPFDTIAPKTSGPLIDPATGNLLPTVSNFINNPLYLTAICNSGQKNKCVFRGTPNFQPAGGPAPYPAVFYLPAGTSAPNISPACASGLPSQFAQSVAGCDPTPYVCGSATSNLWDSGTNPAHGTIGSGGSDSDSDTALGAECLIGLGQGDLGPGLGQDELTYPSGWPAGPPQIKQNSGNLFSTSNSVVTIPIIDSSQPLANHPPVTVIGFLQAFVNYVGYETGSGSANQNYGDVNITVMNVVGCGATPNSTMVVGANGTIAPPNTVIAGGNTPIPIRLITPP